MQLPRRPTCSVCGAKVVGVGVGVAIPICSVACSEALERPTVRGRDMQRVFSQSTAPPPPPAKVEGEDDVDDVDKSW